MSSAVSQDRQVPQQQPRKRRARKADRRGTVDNHKRDVLHAVNNPASVALVSAFSLYWGVRGVFQGCQQLRIRNLRRLVMEVCPVLDKLGVTYWIDFGTLLGAYREKDIIPHDNDADVVILNPDWEYVYLNLKARLPRGFKVYYVVPSEDKSIKWLRVSWGIGIMDLYGGFYDKSAQDGLSDSLSTTSLSAPGTRTSSVELVPTHHLTHEDLDFNTAPVTDLLDSLDCDANNHHEVNDSLAGPRPGLSKSPAAPMAQPPAEKVPEATVTMDESSCHEACISIPQGHGSLCDVPLHLVLPLGRLKFKGREVSVPGNMPGVLRYRYGPTFMVPRYMDKGRDVVEQGKLYARLLGMLGKIGLRI